MRGWDERLKKVGIILSIVFMTPFFVFLVYSFIPTRYLNEKDMKRDLDYMKDLVERAYIDIGRIEDFEKVWYSNYRKVKRKMPRMEFYKIVARTISSLNDHSAFVSFHVPKYMPVMPFEVFRTPDGLFVIESVLEDLPKCSRIISINGRDWDEVVDRLSSYVSAEREEMKYPRISELFHILPTIDRVERYRIVYEIDGERREVSFEAPTKLEYYRMKEKKGLLKPPFYFKTDGEVALLRIRTFSIYKNYLHEWRELIESFGDLDVKTLVIDLRSNEGGSVSRAKELYGSLMASDTVLEKRVVIRANPYSKDTLESFGFENIEGDFVEKSMKSVYKGNEKSRVNVIVRVDRYTSKVAQEFALAMSKSGARIVGEKPIFPLGGNTTFTYHGLPSAGFAISIPDGKVSYSDVLELSEKEEMSWKDYVNFLCGR